MTEAEYRAHLAQAAAYVARNETKPGTERAWAGEMMHVPFTKQYAQPSCRPMPGDHVFIRVGRDIVAWQHTSGTNRCFEPGTRRPIGWQALLVPVIHELDEPITGPKHEQFGTIQIANPD